MTVKRGYSIYHNACGEKVAQITRRNKVDTGTRGNNSPVRAGATKVQSTSRARGNEISFLLKMKCTPTVEYGGRIVRVSVYGVGVTCSASVTDSGLQREISVEGAQGTRYFSIREHTLTIK